MELKCRPIVSIIIPAYNCEKFIADTLKSVRDQTFTNWECIIIDDGSIDNSANIIQRLIENDNRFVYRYQQNMGLSAARNIGLDFANGELVQFLDADDVLLPQKIEKQLIHFDNLKSLPLVISYTNYSFGSSENIFTLLDIPVNVIFNSSDHLSELISRWESTLSIPPHCFLFSAGFFKDFKIRFDTRLANHEDFDCWVNIFKMKPAVYFVNEKLCIYRMTDDSMSKKMKSMGEGFLQTINKHIQASQKDTNLRYLLTIKRLQVLKRYNRFDKMTLHEKFFSFGYISRYYMKRLLQKVGLYS